MFGRNTIPTNAATVTPHDTTANVFGFLYVGTAGTLRITTAAGDVVNFGAVAAGSYIWCATLLVHSSGTSASNIVGFSFNRQDLG